MIELAGTRQIVVDTIAAVVIAAAVVAITSGIPPVADERALDGFAVVLMVAICGSLAVRRRFPITVLLAAYAGLALYTVRGYAGGPVYLVAAVAIYTVALCYQRRQALLATVGGFSVLVVTAVVLGSDHDNALVWVVAVPPWIAAAFLLGDNHRNRRNHLRTVEERARYLEETREEEARRRVAEERLRIARDLHDVLAHNIATINVQAAVAAHVYGRNPEQTVEALNAIKATSHTTLDELRATLDVLRAQGDESEPAPRAPAPGLADLDRLVSSATDAGIEVDQDVRVAQPLPGAVDVATYRIIQESLTNVMRHAGRASVELRVVDSGAAVEISVRDDGRGAASHRSEGGHGINGMRERAALLGGSLAAGSRPGGGFEVQASLPIDPQRPAVPT